MDDDQESANAIVMHLKSDFNVEHFLTVKDALRAIKEKAYNVLILDYEMVREENGIEVLRKIKQNIIYNVPAIMVSAVVNSMQQIEDATNAGFSRYFRKWDPNFPAKLKAAIIELVAQSDNVAFALEKWVKDKPGRENVVVTELNGKPFTVQNILEKLKNNGNMDADARMRLVKYVIEFLVSESMKGKG